MYQNIKQLTISILNNNIIYEYVRICNTGCSEMIQFYKKGRNYKREVNPLTF